MSKSYQATYSETIKFDESCFFIKRPYLKSVQIDFEGRAVNSSKFVDDDPSNRYQGLKTSDFSLENQNMVGTNLPLVKVPISTSLAEETIKSLNDGK